MAHRPTHPSRRDALACMGLAAGTLFVLSGGAPVAMSVAEAAEKRPGRPLFVQISDTHIGFDRAANPDPGATLDRTIDLVNAMPA